MIGPTAYAFFYLILFSMSLIASAWIRKVPNFFQNRHQIIQSNLRDQKRRLNSSLQETIRDESYDYDLVVIGGGSGGMSAAKQAAALGARVILFDYVKPSTQGTTWGLGGTCVNVGCVPKKIMHYASLFGQGLHDASALGWSVNKEETKHDWGTLVQSVQNHVRMLNFRYRGGLRSKDVTYVNALAEFGEDAHTVLYREKKNPDDVKRLRSRYVLIAVGGRPQVPGDVPGAKEHAITSDDLFSLRKSPGKTLCVGGSYIALECAGLLSELGLDVTVAARSILLRGFDKQCGTKVRQIMEELGTKILTQTHVRSIRKDSAGKLWAVLEDGSGQEREESFDTIFYATGRYADLHGLHLERVGVETNSKTGKIPAVEERTNIPSIFAVGDVLEGKPELTPVAVKAGELLAKRLFGGSSKQMDYELVPTTVFTPSEYGCIGLSEEQAVAKYGEDDVEVYLSEFTTLEISAAHRQKHKRKAEGEGKESEEKNSWSMEDEGMSANCLSKLITVKSLGERVVGFHFVGPNAGEVTQGFAVAMKLGATKADFDDAVGIHPTDAESFCALSITKRSGQPYESSGCGGGVCG